MSSTAEATGVDLDALLARIHGNTAAMGQLIALMLEHVPGRLDAVEAAIADGDASALRSAAHSLKGSLSNFTQGPSWHLASTLEEAGRNQELAQAPALFEDLREEVAAVVAVLEAWGPTAP